MSVKNEVVENLKLMVYDEMVVGEELPTMEFQFDEDVQGRLIISLGEENPWYFKESPWGDPITHHALMDDAPLSAVMRRYEYPFGFVHARQETEFINPLPLGKPIKVYSKIVDKYVKRDRGYIVVESLCVDDDGIEILRARNHAMIDDERIREAAKYGLKHIPPSPTLKYKKKSD
jgi:acyl dehydratase